MAAEVMRNSPPKGWRLVLVLAGAYFSFAPIGTLLQMVSQPPGTWFTAIVGATISGVIAICWASIFIFRRYWLLVPLIVAQIVIPALIFWGLSRTTLTSFGGGQSPQGRLVLLAVMTILCIILGYFLIISYTEMQERDATRSRTELELASRIHKTLVPAIDLSTPALRVVGRSEPSSQMGGDLIDVVSERGRVDVYLADVSGHGVKAGVVMAMVKAAIRMRLRSEAELSHLLQDLDAVLQQTVEPGMFATFASMRFDVSDAAAVKASYALAGHLPILHFRARTGEVLDLPNDALPLGIGENEIFGETDMACEAGDTFLLFTDGLTEVADARGRQVGLPAIKSLLRERGREPIEAIHAAVMGIAASHGPQVDDQTLLIVRVTAP